MDDKHTVLTCSYCDKELQAGDEYYEGTEGTIICDSCGDMELHDLTQYDDYPYIDGNEGGTWDGGCYEGEQFRRKVVE